MIRVTENTSVRLLSRGPIDVPASGAFVSILPAASLQVICKVVHRLDADLCWILRVVGGVDSRISGELLSKIELLLGADHFRTSFWILTAWRTRTVPASAHC